MDNKKISFGFNKTTKKPNIIVSHKPPDENKVELIDCLEGQSIKIKNATEKQEARPLEIPVREDARNLLDRVKAIRNKQQERSQDAAKSMENEEPLSNLTLDELAARALIQDAQNWEKHKAPKVSKIQELPLVAENLALEGAEESTIDDYEKVPIVDYGLAMLRGMGWKEGAGIGKNAKLVTMDQPECRPKGLGLGANRMIKDKQKTAVDKDGNELILKQNAYAKIIAGNHQGEYGQVQSMDDENALVFLKTAIKGEVLKLNDIFLVPVTQEEYNMCSRVLNNKKYEEYKALSDKHLKKQYQELSDSEMAHNTDNGKGSRYSNKHSSDSVEKHLSTQNTSKEKECSSQRKNSPDDSDAVKKSRKYTGPADPSSSRNNHRGRNNSRQHSDSDSENGSAERKQSSCSKNQNDKKKGNASRYSSSEDSDDNTDSSPSNRSRSHSRRGHGSSKSNNRSSSSSSNDYRTHRSKSKSGKHDHGRSSSKLKAKHKKHKKKNRHTDSSSNESGYENENRRRKNKTKCRHRRYSNEESEEHYKKNKKNKR